MEVIIKPKFKVLKPQCGYLITQAETSDEERIFVSEICLPLAADESAWTEWTESQVEQWQEEHPIEEDEDEEYQ